MSASVKYIKIDFLVSKLKFVFLEEMSFLALVFGLYSRPVCNQYVYGGILVYFGHFGLKIFDKFTEKLIICGKIVFT